MHRLTAGLYSAALLLASNALSAQPRIEGRTIASVPSSEVRDPTVSPDGRWVVYAKLVSNSDYRVMIQPLAGGTTRELQVGRGVHRRFMFSPQGDRLVFLSSLPRQGTTDDNMYLMGAPFDTRTGMLTAAERQVTLEAVRQETRLAPVISDDGKSVAYVSCCDGSALRVVPVVGGNARTLVSVKETAGGLIPGLLGWTTDSKFVTYHQRVGDKSTYLKVSASGGPSSQVSQWTGGGGIPTPDKRHFVSTFALKPGQTGTGLVVLSIDGRELGRVIVPIRNDPTFSADGKYLVGRADHQTAAIKVTPVSGGPGRQVSKGDGYEWVDQWGRDSRTVLVSTGGKPFTLIQDLEGREVARVSTGAFNRTIGLQDGWFVWSEGRERNAGWNVVARNLISGAQRQLASDVVPYRLCCGVGGPGDLYEGITGSEFYILQVRGDRLQIRAMKVTGESRLLADVPKALEGTTRFKVFENRVVYKETVGDSVRLQMVTAPSRSPATLATFPSDAGIGEFHWSHDGRQLAFTRNRQPQKLFVYRFDASGGLQGAAREFTLPFEYFYDSIWLPDGSGMTMIAQPANGGSAEVALVRFADPSNPILLSKSDPGNKWGHALSPDGKYVAYPVEKIEGSSIFMVDVAELLKRATASP